MGFNWETESNREGLEKNLNRERYLKSGRIG